MISDKKLKRQISLDKELIKLAESQADIEERTLSNLITIALKQYLSKVKAAK